MMYLHLTPDFTPFSNEEIIEYESFTFNGGEPHIKIDNSSAELTEEVTITIRVRSFNDIGLLLVAVDALRRLGFRKLSLYIPYFPGARQDRLMTYGEPLTCKVYADLINSLNFDKVIILDPHSDVTPALLNNCVVSNNHEFVYYFVLHQIASRNATPLFKLPITIISPDAGANKKVKELINRQKVPFLDLEAVYCDKTRDVKTGEITGFKVGAEDLSGKICVIVDDICDGGGTFVGLAKELRAKNAEQVYLAVTHGIFSKGFKALYEHIDEIFTTNSFYDGIHEHEEGVTKSPIISLI